MCTTSMTTKIGMFFIIISLLHFSGYSHDQRKHLPDGMDPGSQKFGLPVIKDCSAGELINPAKTYKQVQAESKKGLDLYKKSHSAYAVGMYTVMF